MTTGVPPSARVSTPTSASEASTPSVGVALISLGTLEALAGFLSDLAPACREFAVDLVVIRRGPHVIVQGLDQLSVRVRFGEAGEDLAALRSRGLAELGNDIIVITTDTEPLTRDWNSLLPRLSQVVQSSEDEVIQAEWVTRLRNAGALDPAV